MSARVKKKVYREYAPELHMNMLLSVGPRCGLVPSQEVREAV